MSRREFIKQSSAFGAASLLGISGRASAEPPPEVKRIKLIHAYAMCLAPQYVAEALLRAEGFESVEYVPVQAPSRSRSQTYVPGMLADGMADFSMGPSPGMVLAADSGVAVTVLAGIHAGCYELFGNEHVQSVRELRGRTIAAAQYGDDRLFISSMMAYVGLDPRKDVKWVTTETMNDSMRLFVEGKVDAFLGFPPQPQELRARKIGRMFLSTVSDPPWSQYFCCMVGGNAEFVRKYPIATKRVLRSFLKAADLCAEEPARVARYMVDKGYVHDIAYAESLVTELPYRRWREADPEDTLRFYALRLRDVGMIKSTPQQIIDSGSEWRFLNELKKEMKA